MKKLIFIFLILFASSALALPPTPPAGLSVWEGGAVSSNIELDGNYLSGDGDDEGIYVDPDGDVGIATNSPTQALEVSGNFVSSGWCKFGDIFLNPTQDSIYKLVRARGSIALEDAAAGGATPISIISGDGATYTDGTITLSADGIDALTVDSTGYVGVGTSDPDVTLEVSGIIKTTPMSSATCDADSEGGVYYDSDDDNYYVCDGSSWVDLTAGAGSTLTEDQVEAYIFDADAESAAVNWTLTGTVDISGATVSLPSISSTDWVDDTDIDWGGGANQVDLADIPGGTAGANAFDFGGATSVEVPNGTNPTTDAAGEIAVDSDDNFLEIYGSESRSIPTEFSIPYTVYKPNELDDSQRDFLPFFTNNTGASITITKIYAMADIDDCDFRIEEYDADGSSNEALVKAETCDTGSGPYINDGQSTITNATVENGHILVIDHDDTDEPDYVHFTIWYTVGGVD